MTGAAFPSVKLSRFDLSLSEAKASTESLFTRFRQVTSLSGGTADRWEGLFETAPLDAQAAKAMMGWGAAVGLFGAFNIADPMYTGPTSGQSTGQVQGAGQTGTSLIVDNVANSTTIVRTGEYFQVGDQYFIATADCTSNGSGVVTLNFRPALRASPADNATVTFTGARLTLRLTSELVKSPDANLLHRFSASFEEYISG